jgi:large subunit ribosomal protein L1
VADATITEAVSKAIAEAKSRDRKFRESVDVAINLKGLDLSNPKNRVEEEIPLPSGRGRAVKIGIFASGELAIRSRGIADTVIQPNELEELANDKKRLKKLADEHSFFLAEAPMMTTIGKRLGTVLGPRGKIPKPVPQTFDPTALVTQLRNVVKVRSRDRRTFHANVGTAAMQPEQLAANIEAVLKRIEAKLEHGRQNISSVFVKTTMGPAQRIL